MTYKDCFVQLTEWGDLISRKQIAMGKASPHRAGNCHLRQLLIIDRRSSSPPSINRQSLATTVRHRRHNLSPIATVATAHHDHRQIIFFPFSFSL